MIFVHALGTAVIDSQDGRVTPRSERKFALLLYLAAERGRCVSRSTLHDLLFPDQTQRNAGHSLRQLLYSLRESGFPITSDANGIELEAGTVRSDYSEVIERDQPDSAQLEAAAGGFLPGFAPAHSEAYSEWYEGYRARSVFELCKAMLREVQRAHRAGDWQMMEKAARACVALDPMNEEGTLGLAEVLAIGGAKTAAVDLLDRYVADVGGRSRDLRLPAAVLRRRINERVLPKYEANASPFVGRSSEIAALERLREDARRGAAGCEVVVGAAGIGKSRLVTEFAKRVVLTGMQVETVGAYPSDALRPMSVFAELVPRLFALPGSLGCSPKSLDSLRPLTRTQAHGSEAPPVDLGSERISRAIRDVVEAITSEAPLLLIIEDAHWLDAISQLILLDLCATTNQRLLILVTSREPLFSAAQLSRARNVRQCVLPPLDREATSELISFCLTRAGIADAPDSREWVRRAAGGNPLFVESLAREYARSGPLGDAPAEVLSLLSRQVDCLGASALSILRMTAVLGKFATIGRVAGTLSLAGHELLAGYEELERAHLIEYEGDAVRAAHALVADAVIQGCGAGWLRLANRQAAMVLAEELERTDSPTLLWQCAQFWIAAGDKERAVALLLKCAEHATGLGRPDAAAESLSRALELDLPTAQFENVARNLVLSASAAGDSARVLRAVEALRDHGFAIGHDEVEFAHLRALSSCFPGDTAVEERLVGCVACDAANDEHKIAVATWALKYADMYSRPRVASRVFERFAVDEANCAAATRLEYQVVSRTYSNDLPQAASAARELTRQIANIETIQTARHLINCGIALWRAGCSEEAIQTMRRGIDIARKLDAVRLLLRLQMHLADVLYSEERDDEADRVFAEAVSLVTQHPAVSDELDFDTNAAVIALQKADVKAAHQYLTLHSSNSTRPRPTQESRWRRACEFRMLQLEGGSWIPDDSLRTLMYPEAAQRQPWLADFEIAIAAFELIRRGRADGVERLVEDYAERRRTPTRLGRQLRMAVAEARSHLDALTASGGRL